MDFDFKITKSESQVILIPRNETQRSELQELFFRSGGVGLVGLNMPVTLKLHDDRRVYKMANQLAYQMAQNRSNN